MKDRYNLQLITTVALLTSAITGCGESDTQATSSTNATEQRASEEFIDNQYNAATYDGGANNLSKRSFTVPTSNWYSNTRPVADISASHTYFSGETVVLDGSGSYDEDGDELRFLWRQFNGPMIELDNRYSDTLSFVAPEVSEPTRFNFLLFVFDGISADIAGFSLQVSPAADDTPPSITHYYPLPNQTDVATDTEISVTFNESLLESGIDGDSLILTHSGSLVPGNVSYDDVSHNIIFSPATYLAGGAEYTVTLGDNIQDIAGNPVASESWTFTTIESLNGDNADGGAGDNPVDGGNDNTNDGAGDNPVDASPFNLGSTNQQTIDACMDNEDKKMLTLVNNARAQTRSCGTMSYQAAPPLAWNCQLENAAYGHSLSMAENDYFSHTGIDGSSPGDRITAAGYDWRTYGENIAAGYRDAESVMEGWLNSPGHCANLMHSSFKDIGVGVVNGSGSYGIYWTQEFAAQ